jgi:hypothetical protein
MIAPANKYKYVYRLKQLCKLIIAEMLNYFIVHNFTPLQLFLFIQFTHFFINFPSFLYYFLEGFELLFFGCPFEVTLKLWIAYF